MVASVSSSANFIPKTASVGRPADTRVDAENISSTLRRNVAITAKFGPDPATGSPFQLISGEDVEAAETVLLIVTFSLLINSFFLSFIAFFLTIFSLITLKILEKELFWFSLLFS